MKYTVEELKSMKGEKVKWYSDKFTLWALTDDSKCIEKYIDPLVLGYNPSTPIVLKKEHVKDIFILDDSFNDPYTFKHLKIITHCNHELYIKESGKWVDGKFEGIQSTCLMICREDGEVIYKNNI